MNERQRQEERELNMLSPLAAKAAESKGRVHPQDEDDLRTAFQRDRDRLIHSKAFRRLQFKTQVFIAPEGDHYRSRLTHTLEVTQIARSIARALNLNEDLTEAIALGHDLGHTPFGHIGERTLNSLYPDGFRHNEQSLRVVERLEGEGGLNLSYEVRDGILNHPGRLKAQTLEGRIVAFADRIAYINHDIDDALRAGVIHQHEIPADCLKVLGSSHGQRIDTMITDLVKTSRDKEDIAYTPEVAEATDRMRSFLFRTVYQDKWRNKEEERADHVVRALYRYYQERPGELPLEYIAISFQEGLDRAALDYVASMTDRFALRVYHELFIPQSFGVVQAP